MVWVVNGKLVGSPSTSSEVDEERDKKILTAHRQRFRFSLSQQEPRASKSPSMKQYALNHIGILSMV